MSEQNCRNIKEAAERAMTVQGFLVALFVYGYKYKPGDTCVQWAEYPFPITITGDSTREEWDAQWKLLLPQKKDSNPHGKRATYYRAVPQNTGKENVG